MAVIVSSGDIRKFYDENRFALKDEYRLVAEDDDVGVEVYITEENGHPYFTVEVDGTVEYEAQASSETEIETVYAQLLNLYISEDGEEDFSEEDLERISEINSATYDYLSVLLECEPESCFDDDCIDEIVSSVEELLCDVYGLSVRHPTADGNRVIQYPYSEEVE